MVSLIETPSVCNPPFADCTVNADRLGDEGLLPSATPSSEWLFLAEEGLQVAVEIAVASEIGIRQRPFPCKYCMADPISFSISFTTWFSAILIVSLFEDDVVPLVVRPAAPPLATCTRSRAPYMVLKQQYISYSISRYYRQKSLTHHSCICIKQHTTSTFCMKGKIVIYWGGVRDGSGIWKSKARVMFLSVCRLFVVKKSVGFDVIKIGF